MKLAINKLTNKTLKAFNEQEIQFRWTGFAKSLPKQLIDKLKLMEKKTSHNKKIILNICLNYGGKQDILQAVEQTKKTNKSFEELLLTKDLPSIDLLIRTGNEKRISNFML
jgi:undecaprenyl diphosphate synthase